MLLFSTLLHTTESLTADAFIRLILKWNEESTYEENRVKNIHWQGEHNGHYGDPMLWIEMIEDPERGILAVRHEKVTPDKVVWDSDFTLNWKAHQIAIRLDRTYSDEALVTDAAFSTPHFITLLIEHGYLQHDADLPVLRTPILMGEAENAFRSGAFFNSENYALPVVRVTRTDEGKDPLDVNWLASRLKGAAHVLIEEPEEPYNYYYPFGYVTVFFPSGNVKNQRFVYQRRNGREKTRLEKIIRCVIQYWLVQQIDPLYTWQGLRGIMQMEKMDRQSEFLRSLESARKEAEEEISQVYEIFDAELKLQKDRISELASENESLRAEIRGLRAKYSSESGQPLIYAGDEEDLYEDEICDLLLTILEDIQKSAEAGTRRADILKDILQNNTFRHLTEERRKKIKSIFRGYTRLTSAMRQELQELGFEIQEDGKHYKFIPNGDARYMVTIARTPSDNRAGDNNASTISKKVY